jgi:glycolate oxidase iron-sulfur subunit
MQTNLGEKFKLNSAAQVVEQILRKCVHCGFCNATCPTYQLTGDELDGPRGRIYQMKQFFEGAEANPEIRKHLDRCLTCRSCETTCPSGVNYSRLLEAGRESLDQALPRPLLDRYRRAGLTWFLNSGWLFRTAVEFARSISGVLPQGIKSKIPASQKALAKIQSSHSRRVLMLSGCVQPTLAPNTNAAATRLLDSLGIQAVEISITQCCGSVGLHTSRFDQGRAQARKLIDLWWPQVESGVEAIVVTATGCAVTIRDYTELFESEPAYAHKAETIAGLTKDLSEILTKEFETQTIRLKGSRRVAFHSPCTLQHGLGLAGKVEGLLASAGYHLCRVDNGHLCCGSAGTYSLLQPELSSSLRSQKQLALSIDSPEVIATANVGCQVHIASGSKIPVVHWVELLNDAMVDS